MMNREPSPAAAQAVQLVKDGKCVRLRHPITGKTADFHPDAHPNAIYGVFASWGAGTEVLVERNDLITRAGASQEAAQACQRGPASTLAPRASAAATAPAPQARNAFGQDDGSLIEQLRVDRAKMQDQLAVALARIAELEEAEPGILTASIPAPIPVPIPVPLIIETSVVDPDMASAMGEMSAAVKAMAALLETVGKINLEGMPDEEINAMGRALKAEKERRRSA